MVRYVCAFVLFFAACFVFVERVESNWLECVDDKYSVTRYRVEMYPFAIEHVPVCMVI